MVQQLVRAAFFGVQFTVAYLLMLVAMYYNGYMLMVSNTLSSASTPFNISSSRVSSLAVPLATQSSRATLLGRSTKKEVLRAVKVSPPSMMFPVRSLACSLACTGNLLCRRLIFMELRTTEDLHHNLYFYWLYIHFDGRWSLGVPLEPYCCWRGGSQVLRL